MKRILIIICSTLIVASCNTKQTNSAETTNNFEKDKTTTHNFEKDKTTLYVATINTTEPESKQVKNLNELPPVNKDEIRIVTTDNFEISLNELANGAGYYAVNNVTEPTAEKGSSKMEYICDWCGATTEFKTTAGFINFMATRGYKLVSQTDHIHSKDYKFNKI